MKDIFINTSDKFKLNVKITGLVKKFYLSMNSAETREDGNRKFCTFHADINVLLSMLEAILLLRFPKKSSIILRKEPLRTYLML